MGKLPVGSIRPGLHGAMAAAGCALLPGCRPGPDVTVACSYFPSWMASLVVGVFATMLCWKLFTRTGLDPYLGPRVLVYPALVILITLILWGMFRG